MSDDLVEWLRAQLDADQRPAQLAAERYTTRGPYAEHPGEPYWPLPSVVARFRDADEGIAAGLTLIETYSPARVLREVEALRAIVDLHSPRSCNSYSTDTGEERIQCEYCAGLCHSRSGLGCDDPVDALYPCDTVRLVAAIFESRPGYQESWRP